MNEKNIEIWRTLMEKGTVELGQAKYQLSEKSFQQSLRIANQLNIPIIKAFNLRLLALSQIRQGKIHLAERGFKEALHICEEISNVKGMSEALAGLANVEVENNNIETAIDFYKKAIEIYPDESPQLRLAMLYSDLGQSYAMLDRWDEAEKTYLLALELCHQHDYHKGEGELSVLMGESCFRQGDKNKAKKCLIYACRIFVQVGEMNSLINALQYLGFMYYEQGAYEDASLCLRRALTLQIRSESWEDAYETSFFLAKILNSLGELEEAIVYLAFSINLHVEKDLGLALRVQNMAKILCSKKEYVKGKVYYQEAADLFEFLGDDLKLGECYEGLALICDILGEEAETANYRKEAKRTYISHHAISLSAVQRLAEYYEQRRNYFNALRCYWQSLQIAREIGYETAELEQAVQRISERVRKKSFKFTLENSRKR